MDDALALFAVLATLYLIRSAVWVDRYAVGFRTPQRALLAKGTRGRHRRRDAARAWGNRQRALLVADFVPLPAPLVLARPWPISLGPRAALGFIAQTPLGADHPEQTGRLAPPDVMARVEVAEKRLLAGGLDLAGSDSARSLQQMAALLRRLGSAAAAERERLITEAIEKHFDDQSAATRWAAFRRHARPVHGFALALHLYLFVLAPAVVFTEGLALRWRELAAGLVILLAGTLTSYLIAHRRLYPEDALERWSSALGMLLIPPEATRAADLLARDVLVEFHPLAVARILADHQTFLAMSREFLRDLAHPMASVRPALPPASRETEHWYRERIETAARALITRAGAGAEELLAPPRPRGEDSLSYCPRCHVQFEVARARCSDCGGLETAAFARADCPGTMEVRPRSNS